MDIALTTEPLGVLSLTAAPGAMPILVTTAPLLSLPLSATPGAGLGLNGGPIGLISVGNVLAALDLPNFAALNPNALIDEYGAYLLDENGNPLLWQ